MKKIIIILALFTVILILGVGYLLTQKTAMAEKEMRSFFKNAIGVDAEIDGLEVRFEPGSFMTKLQVTSSEIRLMNLPGFLQKNLATVREIEAVVETCALWKGQWKASKMTYLISDVNIERNLSGDLNLSKMPALSGLDRAQSNFEAGRVESRIGSLHFWDAASDKAEPEPHDFQGMLEVYDHVRDARVLVLAPALKMVYALGKGSLGLPLGKIQEFVRSSVGEPLSRA